MKQFCSRLTITIGFVVCLLLGVSTLYAEVPMSDEDENPVSSMLKNMTSLHAPQANWVISGTVTNESGDRFHYFFQIQANNNAYQGTATLIDAQTKQVVLYEEGNSVIDASQTEITKKQAGKLFLRFNPISNSWVFGVKHSGVKKDKGFNFKIDMLEASDAISNHAKEQALREGIVSLINQTGRLNGHINNFGSQKEEFVTAEKAWFRQIWLTKPQGQSHALTAILCQFNDGGALYSLALPEMDALRASVAGRRDANGAILPISQFVTAHEGKDNIWKIQVPLSKGNLIFENLLSQMNDKKKLVVGMTSGKTSGFCAVNKEEFEIVKDEKSG